MVFYVGTATEKEIVVGGVFRKNFLPKVGKNGGQ